jgi:hypothetical protein
MDIQPLGLSGVFSIAIERRTDERGFFARSFCVQEFADKALEATWVQANTSFSAAKGTVRGMHFQRPPKAEVKLVRCVRGAALDVVVDIRAGSPTYGRWIGYELTAEARNAIYVPHGFRPWLPDAGAGYGTHVFRVGILFDGGRGRPLLQRPATGYRLAATCCERLSEGSRSPVVFGAATGRTWLTGNQGRGPRGRSACAEGLVNPLIDNNARSKPGE